ncbi:MAG TPA: hypothetical protein VNV43_12965 [Candidatus Acidoferrales bacterium]|nr:hypothetical protein [Candidatus Acidoferrales bacterium]
MKAFICLALALITFGLYWPARHFTFLLFDDQYFLQDPRVAGLSPAGFFWALTSVVAENWHPITTLSFLLTHQFWGLNAGAEHMLNAGIHAANAVLLFLVLLEMTGGHEVVETGASARVSLRRLLQCAIVAAIFAWHPLRVESVAWIAERKDVLFMFFMLLSLLCYTRYARAAPRKLSGLPPPDKRTIFDIPRRKLFYNLALLFFVLSLLSKAMSVTLPFLLLLLDVWPLKRFHGGRRSEGATAKESEPPHVGSYATLLTEKLPFFIASALFCYITFHIQKAHDALASLHQIGAGVRMENVISSYVGYLGKFFWPSSLAVIYPFPTSFDAVQVILSGLLLIVISFLCILQLPRRPYLAVGWFWFLGTMVPVIGLVQLGEQGMADRYTYLPLIGPVISLVWLVSDWVGAPLFASGTTGAVERSSADSPPAIRAGAAQRAVPALLNFRKWAAVSATALILAACAVLTTRQLSCWRNTVTLFTRTLAVTRNNSLAEFPLARALENEGFVRQAAVHYRIAIARGPDPENFWPNFYFAELLDKEGHYQEAIKRMETAVQIKPNQTDAVNNLAWILSTCPDQTVREGDRAVKLAERACELTHGGSAKYLTTLAAAYAEVGRFDDAIATVQKAGELAQERGQMGLFNGDAELLQLFNEHQTYTDKSNVR